MKPIRYNRTVYAAEYSNGKIIRVSAPVNTPMGHVTIWVDSTMRHPDPDMQPVLLSVKRLFDIIDINPEEL